MNPEKVSVLTPCLNETGWMGQNREILKKDSRVTEFVYEKGVYPISQARQDLLRKAKNNYLLWLDSDVELLCNPLDLLFEYMRKDNIAGVCFSPFELDPGSEAENKNLLLLPPIYEMFRAHFNCGLFKKDALEEVGGFNTSLISGEDNEIQIRLKHKGWNVLGIRDYVVRHHSIVSSYTKKKSYYQGRKYIFNTYELSSIIHPPLIKEENLAPPILLKSLQNKCVAASSLIRKWIRYLGISFLPKSLFRPKEAGILITERCFFKCKSCTYWQATSQDPSFSQICTTINRLDKAGFKNVALTGGEPLLHNDLERIIDYLRAKSLRCLLITNGFLGEENIHLLCKCHHIVISIDGMRKTHNLLRGMDSWDKAADLAFELKTKYNQSVSINFVLQEENYQELAAVKEFFKVYDIPVEVLCYNSGGMGQPQNYRQYIKETEFILNQNINFSFLTKKYIKLLLCKFNNKITKQRCLVPHYKIMVDAKGDVFPCSAWFEGVGNIVTEDFSSIWKKYRGLRKQICRGRHQRCLRCNSCELSYNFMEQCSFLQELLSVKIIKRCKRKIDTILGGFAKEMGR